MKNYEWRIGGGQNEVSRLEFGHYSKYYDLLYADKDYSAEALFVLGRLKRYQASVRRIVEFGCGTGRHGRLLAGSGCTVIGIDRSSSMIQMARMAIGERSSDPGFQCIEGDVRRTQAPGDYDAVISLFHVVGYQISDDDVNAVFANACQHLGPGGLFLFDVWHAPAVLTLGPTVRIRRVEDEHVHVTRIAEPKLLSDRDCVKVNYTLFVQDKTTGKIVTFGERHEMRYFTTSQIQMMGMAHGFEMVHVDEWLTGRPAGTDTWSVCYVLRQTEGR